MKEYLPRIADKLLEERLYAKGAVLIDCTKWCEKTKTAKQKAKQGVYIKDNFCLTFMFFLIMMRL